MESSEEEKIMYGKRKYGRLEKSVEQPAVDPTSEPNFICAKCRKIYRMANLVELTWVKGNINFMYTRLCCDCTELLKTWIKG
jgi:hypothetical protein